jgi:hypothetical protein
MMSREGAGNLPGKKQEPKPGTLARPRLFQPGAIMQLFREVKNTLTPKAPAQASKRKRREDARRFFTVTKKMLRRVPRLPAEAYAAAASYLADTLDGLNPWHTNDTDLNEDFQPTPSDHLYPHL